MNEELLKKAKEYIKEPDIIVDLFDFSINYLSDKAQKMSGFSNEDLSENVIRLTDVFGFMEKEARDKVWEDNEEHGIRDFIAKTKSGKYKLKIEFYAFNFEKTKYRVGKIIQAEKI